MAKRKKRRTRVDEYKMIRGGKTFTVKTHLRKRPKKSKERR